jgi:hypothetical protein
LLANCFVQALKFYSETIKIYSESVFKNVAHFFMAENREFYIKYLDNHAVAIDTSYGRGPDGRLALLTVAHLIGAVSPLA